MSRRPRIKGRHLSLRPIRQEEDLPVFFENQRDPDANRMAAFTAKEPDDREAFMVKWAVILADPEVTVRVIESDGPVAGSVMRWRDPELPGPEVSYWIGREFWGRGIDSEALAQFLLEISERQLFGRAAADNVGSLRVLDKCGFKRVGSDRGFSNARRAEIEEMILKLGG